MTPRPPEQRRSRLDAVMPYAPALIVAIFVGAFIFIFSVSTGTPRVWPGVVLAFVSNLLALSYRIWLRQRKR